MACNRHLYNPSADKTKTKLNLKIAKYKQEGTLSKLITE
jgi:hypothetical protein